MGTYALASTQISMPRLLFQWKHSKTPKQIKAGNMPTLVYIPKDVRALDVKLKQPPLSACFGTSQGKLLISHSVELGTMSRIRVLLSTGRNEVATAVVKLSAPSGIHFRYDDTQLIGDGA